jgi:hypothetical protein
MEQRSRRSAARQDLDPNVLPMAPQVWRTDAVGDEALEAA